MYANGKIEVMKEGETAKELNYEVEDMQAAVLRKTDRHQSGNVREQWGITYPFEYENIRPS
ncbi:hypothetical protein P9293_11625 [Bacillus inaquosorum]|nr:hypothetical protein [Bacillus inaquosorum]MEC2065873.1 hypothetical protein [Bacillus inaquosorum]MEC2085057.1 hypothetical protein [Bacillus inaquosorum]MED4648067.1 hypothetical protein [Bacillus inaquosorum]MED4789386.1 hypothetical protein [Bacillus inaquosorum]WNW22464.1 hypothetical protein RS399_11875 [Bacillus inaquosorum]